MQNLASLMTLTQYQEQVTPVIKEYQKFLKKNIQWFKNVEYYGFYQKTYSQYIENEKAREYFDKSYADKRWINEYQKINEEPHANVLQQYNSFIEKLSIFFSEQDLKNIQKDEIKSNKRTIRRAIDSDFYIDALKDGLVTPQKLVEIFASVGIKMTSRIEKMKYKVEVEGYDRLTELAQAKKTKEFEDTLRKELKPYYDSLKEREKLRLTKIIAEFEEKYQGDISNIKYDHRTGNMKDYQNYQNEIQYFQQVRDFFTSNFSKTKDLKIWKAEKIEAFDQLMENKITAYAENFITTLVYRLELKFRVINSKLGQPVLHVESYNTGSGIFEGNIKATWSNGVEILIETEVIIAGGMIQTDHYRYLIKPFYKGKFIDLENIDSLNF
jgi:hypothetical protein